MKFLDVYTLYNDAELHEFRDPNSTDISAANDTYIHMRQIYSEYE